MLVFIINVFLIPINLNIDLNNKLLSHLYLLSKYNFMFHLHFAIYLILYSFSFVMFNLITDFTNSNVYTKSKLSF